MTPSRLLAALTATIVSVGPSLAADITVGVAGPMSGPFATFGEQMRLGAERAVADLNKSGGVGGRTVRLAVEDTKCEANTASAVANRLVGKGASLVIGHFCSRSSIAAAPIYAQNRIVQISPASPNPSFTEDRPNPEGGTYRLGYRADREAAAIATYLIETFPRRRLAVLHDGTAFGKGLAEDIKSQLNRAGRPVRFQKDYRPGQKSYRKLIAELVDAAIDVAFIGGYHADIALIAKQINERANGLRIVSADPILTDDFVALANDGAIGVIAIAPPDPLDAPEAQPVIEAMRRDGIDPSGYVLPAYAAVQVWSAAVRGTGAASHGDLVKALNSGTFETVLGPVSFDGRGNASLPDFVAYEWTTDGYRRIR